ncbi:Hypothetical predicted protein [Olea europaea subsp. europaea]|uniref:Transmembrane protein n=1 Tax=Olea europaea subsp. europaea TaxID=158383 RepID=A0A8S0R9W2_OLEEU|nr:Hypothetical predicted protein [Olea europaea subsp. europaea]
MLQSSLQGCLRVGDLDDRGDMDGANHCCYYSSGANGVLQVVEAGGHGSGVVIEDDGACDHLVGGCSRGCELVAMAVLNVVVVVIAMAVATVMVGLGIFWLVIWCGMVEMVANVGCGHKLIG